MHLHLVRHAPSRPDPAIPADRWGLARDADSALARLADVGVLPRDATWFASTEPKALLTARRLTRRPVRLDPRLKEQVRDATWFERPDEFVACVARAFARPDERATVGWEPLVWTLRRITEVVAQLEPSGPVVLVGHGTAWTALVAALTGTSADLAGWQAMAMPDHCLLDTEAGRLLSGWGAWREGSDRRLRRSAGPEAHGRAGSD